MQNSSRSQNQDLRKGILDGSYKSLTPDRGGDVDESTSIKRSMVVPPQYGVTPKSPLAEATEPTISL
jgi:hypothetical protein